MEKLQTVDVPIRVFLKLQDALADLEPLVSSYQPAFLARMYRARASDLEGKGKRLSKVKRHFHHPHG